VKRAIRTSPNGQAPPARAIIWTLQAPLRERSRTASHAARAVGNLNKGSYAR